MYKLNNIEIKEYYTFFKKLKGLMFKKDFNYGIRLTNCNSIHTFFMKEKIDVIITNKNNKILYIAKSLKPNKIIWPIKHGFYVFELPENSINNLKINQYLDLREKQ